ncbi:hypothetical protein PAXINDRAFT_173439 [Paxillus involutus ATCC 200175]|uniref:Uncharacterized protein n=1 Tax=Paxillus involutus ATCC 200175 TaxID=664439 RepID=A0A0C9SX78_PAXIN|nr:hypothetical protein PAXINDRAFT_173439 [Paxillus involutus ATCC 200175]
MGGDILSTVAHFCPGADPKLLQQSFETLRSGNISKLMESFETLVDSTTTLGTTLRSIIETLVETARQDDGLHALSEKIVFHLRSVLDDLLAEFHMPASESAPGHVERVRSVSEFVEQAQQWIIRVGEMYEVQRGVLEPHLAIIRPYVEELWVLVGDIIELHPEAITKLVWRIVALLPGMGFVKPLVTLFCFGPSALGEDLLGGWMFKKMFGWL